MVAGPFPFGEIHIKGDEMATEIVLDDQFGANSDVVIDRELGFIYMKASGTWEQIYPAIVL
jgi:hypothetical protein